nr:MAG TPA: DNA-packaging protein small subunit [Caudoviricetes sp.]
MGRPEKFKTPEELRKLFNLYLASCQELVKVPKEVPKETHDRDNIRF